MIRFGLEVSNISQTSEELRKNIADLIYAINEMDSELAHMNLMCLKLALNRLNEQVAQLMRSYEMKLDDDQVKKNVT